MKRSTKNRGPFRFARRFKDAAPSPELRKWFHHDPARWKEFQSRYAAELKDRQEALHLLREKARGGTVTLVYAARDEEHNGARALKQVLESGKPRRARGGPRGAGQG